MRSGSCQISSYNGRVMGMTICLAPRGGCGGVGFRRRSTRRVSGRASISASSSVVRKRMTRMPPAGYPAPQYLQSDRVRIFPGSKGSIWSNIMGRRHRHALPLARGKSPEAFLRGCGVPEALITYLPSLIGAMSPIQFYSVFISYSSKDRDFADRLYADLQAKGIRCWLDHEHLKIGDEIRDVIEVNIRVHDKLLLVLSAHSVASEWVRNEVETALEKERRQGHPVLFPIRLDDAVMEAEAGWAGLVRRRHIGDFRGWKEHD